MLPSSSSAWWIISSTLGGAAPYRDEKQMPLARFRSFLNCPLPLPIFVSGAPCACQNLSPNMRSAVRLCGSISCFSKASR